MKLKVAIVGCGKIADGHVEEIQKLPQAELVGVCDLEELIAEQMAVRYHVPKFYGNFEEMIAETHPDVVHITTPPQSHLILAQKAVDSGCHVYVEKPVGIDASECKRLVEYAVSAKRKMTVNYWPNFDPPGLALKTLVEEGALGDVVHLESFLGYNLSGAFGQALLADPQHWVHRLPGKLFQNNLDHVLNKIVPLLPDTTPEIKVVSYKRRESQNGDVTDDLLDELRVIIRAQAVTAYATFSSHARPAAHFVRIYGTKNTVHVDYNLRTVCLEKPQNIPSALGRLFPPFQQTWQLWRQALLNSRDFARSRAHYFRGMNTLISEFYRSIADDTPVPIPYSHIVRASELMDEIISRTEKRMAVAR